MRGDNMEIRAEKTTVTLDNAELWIMRALFERLAREARRPSPDGVSHIVITTQELMMIDQLNANLQQLVP
jgi:hypothetical protein